ncbi:hypothetical protein, partial [Bacillus sp. CDB3]|uniref:hypothetical protein n=1 Tax=Bacillus sp. CDB3 TaxID=360310 RepID=UPI0009D8827F
YSEASPGNDSAVSLSAGMLIKVTTDSILTFVMLSDTLESMNPISVTNSNISVVELGSTEPTGTLSAGSFSLEPFPITVPITTSIPMPLTTNFINGNSISLTNDSSSITLSANHIYYISYDITLRTPIFSEQSSNLNIKTRFVLNDQYIIDGSDLRQYSEASPGNDSAVSLSAGMLIKVTTDSTLTFEILSDTLESMNPIFMENSNISVVAFD